MSHIERRKFLLVGVAAAAFRARGFAQERSTRSDMYGLIGKMTAVPGKRDDLIAVLVAGTGEMPGCLSYIVATDAKDADALWITEAWDSKASHDASLTLPHVKEAIAKGKPLIAGFSDGVVTTPIGGHGLVSK